MSQESASVRGPFDHPAALAALALATGALWGWCSGSEARPLVAWVALAPLFLLMQRPRGILWAGLFAVASWLVAMPWIPPTLATFGGLPTALAQGLGVLLAIYLALDTVLFAWLGRRLPRDGVTAWWALPALWVVIESLRGFFFGGFPWNLAAYAWVDFPGALPLAAWIGAAGVSYLVALANVALALGISRRRPGTVVAVWLSILWVLAVGGRFAGADAGAEAGADAAAGGAAVRVVQPNTGIVYEAEEAWANYQDLITLSHAACDRPALLVWPESAAWPLSWESGPRLRRDVESLVRRGCPVVLGSSFQRPEGILNGALLVDAEGGLESPGGEALYAKRRLVPFGEYVPLKEVLPFVGNLARQAGDFTAGTEPALLEWGAEKLALAICYEVIFAGPVAEQVRAGGSVLVTITNDAWYGDSSAPHQHLRAAQFRAAENRRPLLRAALTGISAVIDPRGRIVDSLGVGQRGVLAAEVAGSRELSPFSRAPWAPIALAAVLSGFAIIRPAVRRRR